MFSRRRFAVNAISHATIRLITGAGNLLIWPHIIIGVGFTLYGAYVLIATTLTYISLLDLSLGTVFLKLVAETPASADKAQVNAAAWLLILYTIALGGIVTLVAALGAEPAGRMIFHVAATHLDTWRGIAIASALVFTVNAAGSVFSFALAGLQLISEQAVISLTAWAISIAVTLFTLHLGASVWSLVYGAAAASVSTSLIAFALVRRRYPGFRVLFQPHAFAFLRRNAGFSAGLQVSRVVDLVNLQLDPVLIGAVSSTRSVAFYDIGMTLASIPKDLTAGIVSAYFPEATARASRKDEEGAARLYWTTLYLLVTISAFLAGGVAATAPLFIPIWFQRQVPYAALVAGLLAVANAAHQITAPGTNWLFARGRSGWASLYAVAGAAANVALTVPLAILFGFSGIVWGTCLGLTAGSLLFFVYFHRLFMPGLRTAVWVIARAAAAAGLALVAGRLAGTAIPVPGSQRIAAITHFGLDGMAYVCAFGALALALDLISARSILMTAHRVMALRYRENSAV